MRLFIPEAAYIDPKSLQYEKGQGILARLQQFQVPIIHSKVVKIEEETPAENYMKAKNTVLVTVNNQRKLAPCRPSADYQFTVSSSCPANCEYCYLQTTQGEKPYIRLFANIDDILQVIESHIDSNKPDITTFECASITDPVALEHLTGSLASCIDFFGKSEFGRLRLVTKFSNVDSFLQLNHQKHTKIRFSVNARYVINNFEHKTASFSERIEAAKKMADAGYPIGFIIAPIMVFDSWKEEYAELFETLKHNLQNYEDEISFELIQHRFTLTAKELIQNRFKSSKLDMEVENRTLKWGPYGKFKYVYPKEKSTEMKEYMTHLVTKNFDRAIIEYFT